jgi:tetratricopeptide (TPR) repeat protein
MKGAFSRRFLLVVFATLLAACSSAELERQAGEIREQEAEIARQRKELEALRAGQQRQDQKQKDCARAFRDYFDKAPQSTDRDRVISLYREGLAFCPDDDVAHYELGRALADAGHPAEAEKEYEAALKINPDFGDARRQLEAVRLNR